MTKERKRKSDKTVGCPRCKASMQEVHEKTAFLDRCPKGHGTFFDQGEMFEALGAAADPSLWDRRETSGPVREGKLGCPRCGAKMLLQDISAGSIKVEIDRCGSCGGIWLDHGEAEKLMAIGSTQVDKAFAERRAAQADLDKLSDVDFRSGGAGSLIRRFLGLFQQ
jgi:Zn-finger nucleic acid-binding protein